MKLLDAILLVGCSSVTYLGYLNVKVFIQLIGMMMLTIVIGCSSTPKKLDYGGSLSEVMRAGVPQVEPYPNYYNYTSHTCTSTPLWDLNGEYLRHDVRCH